MAGEKEKALTKLQHAVADVPTYLSAWPARDPDLESLRDEPEFIRMFGSGDHLEGGSADSPP